MYKSPVAQAALAALRAKEEAKVTKPRATDYRGPRLRADGAKALAMLKAGRTIPDIMLVMPGSRARLYRAMAIVRAESRDPLLL